MGVVRRRMETIMRSKVIGISVIFLLLLSVPAFAQAWQYAYQQEEPYDFKAVDFPTSSAGYAVAADGAIYKSTDAGDSFVQQTSPVTEDLYDVFFLTSTNGWAVGQGGVILVTTDGTTWTEHASSRVVTTATLKTVFFIGSNGWIGGNGGVVFYTTNGGTTWNPPTVNPYTDDVNAIQFVDNSIGYAAVDGDGIMYTIDGGDNWLPAAVNLGPYPYTRDDIESILMIDDTLAVATGWGSLVGLQPTIILISEDAGKTWNTPDPTYPWQTYGYGYALARFDNREVILTGGGTGSAAFVHHRAYGSDSWTNTPPIMGDDTRGACAVPGTDRVVVVGDGGCIALSKDRGVTWEFVANPSPGFAGWHDFAHVDGNIVTFVAGANSSFLTIPYEFFSDPVLYPPRFSVVAPENFAPSTITDVDYVDEVLYYCGNYGYLCKSTDLGLTWQQIQHTPTVTTAIYGMYWFDKDNGILVGEVTSQEHIWRTTDGGQTLNIVWADSTGTNLQFNTVSFAPDNQLIGVAAGDDNAIAYTTDGGLTWAWASEDIATSSRDIEAVWMVDANVGWMVGDAGTHLKTTDGGQNWFVQPTVTTKNLMDVQFKPWDGDFGWMAGDDTTVVQTIDDGANWTEVGPSLDPTSKDVNAVHYQSVINTLWIGADYGDCMYQTNTDVTTTDNPASAPYSLAQNVPNPFNPSTMIKFSIPSNDHVVLNVYDVGGRLVETILDKQMDAGDHIVHFEATGYASGVYFYRLSTSAGVQTRKMVLLR